MPLVEREKEREEEEEIFICPARRSSVRPSLFVSYGHAAFMDLTEVAAPRPFVLSIARHEVRPDHFSLSTLPLHDISASVEEADNLTLLTMGH